MKRLIAIALGVSALVASNPVEAQTVLVDAVTQVGDVTFNDTATSYINIAACSDPSGTDVTIRLEEMGALSEVALYVGGQNDACEESVNRNGVDAVCFEATGNLQTVQPNSQIIVTVADLEASGKLDCTEGGSLQGTPLKLYSFRNADPGTSAPEDLTWGVAEVTVDVKAPDAPSVTNMGDQPGTQFEVTWTTPTDDLLRYNLFQRPGCDDPDGGASEPVLVPSATANGDVNSISVSAGSLDFSEHDTVALFVQAIDQAENESDLSMEEVCVEFVPTGGFCSSSGECEGCSVSAAGLGRSLTKTGMVGLVLLVSLVGWRRLR